MAAAAGRRSVARERASRRRACSRGRDWRARTARSPRSVRDRGLSPRDGPRVGRTDPLARGGRCECSTKGSHTGVASSMASAAASSARRRASCTSSPGTKPHNASHRSIGSGYSAGRPVNTVTTVTPGWRADEVGATEHRVVEVRRDDDESFELARVDDAPFAHLGHDDTLPTHDAQLARPVTVRVCLRSTRGSTLEATCRGRKNLSDEGSDIRRFCRSFCRVRVYNWVKNEPGPGCATARLRPPRSPGATA